MRNVISISVIVSLLAAAGGFALARAGEDAIQFSDAKQQTLEFMRYNDTIELTPAQEEVKKTALTAIPAPCCSDNSSYTCCCPCNMAKTIWGLSAYLIAEKGLGAEAVKAKVEEWIDFINPDGFSGDVCYSAGGCNRAFADNGCGGMHPSRLAF